MIEQVAAPDVLELHAHLRRPARHLDVRPVEDLQGGLREVVALVPNRALYRVNLALYAAYAGDFDAAEASLDIRQVPSRHFFIRHAPPERRDVAIRPSIT